MSKKRVDVMFKILIVGECGVGKTSIIKRYVYNLFTPNYKSTIGVDFALKILKKDKLTIGMQLWDVAGQERFGSMTRVYYKDATAAIIMFDVNHLKSFESVMKWKNDIVSKIFKDKNIPMLLVANKVDLAVHDTQWHEFKKTLDNFCVNNEFIGWIETSAKDNMNIDAVFTTLTDEILKITDIPQLLLDQSSKEIIKLDDVVTDESPRCICA